MPRHPTLVPGSIAPAFALPSHRGETRSLTQYLGEGPLLLAFHRGTW